jgi:hypothetical protein
MKRTITAISLAVFVSSLFTIGVSLGPDGGRRSILPSVQAKMKVTTGVDLLATVRDAL